MTANFHKAKRILRTCLVESLDVQLGYYSSLPNYTSDWDKELVKNTISSIISLFPLFVPAEPFVSGLYDTAREYMAERKKAAKESKAAGAVQISRKELRDLYQEEFPDVIILDICWAATQHYSEWKRWLRNAVKDGSAPDRAFRAILTSGKFPREYRKQRRPSGWK